MLTKHFLNSIVLMCLLLITAGPSLGSENRVDLQTPQEQELRQLEELGKRAYALRKQELASPTDQNLRMQRAELYAQLAGGLTKYIKTYIRDTNSLDYLIDVFWTGLSWELGERNENAYHLYLICKSHRLINDPKALYEERSIASLIDERIQWSRGRIDPLVAKRIERGFSSIELPDGEKFPRPPKFEPGRPRVGPDINGQPTRPSRPGGDRP